MTQALASAPTLAPTLARLGPALASALYRPIPV